MSSLKEIKNRIGSVKSTRQITSAMKMVASAKLHKVQGRIESLWPYQQKLQQILTNFLSTDASFCSPYTAVRPIGRVAIVVCASNTSLCGAYNANVVKALERLLDSYAALPKEAISLYPIGKKVEEAVKKWGYTPCGDYTELADKPSYADARALAQELMRRFVGGEIDEVRLVYHHFKSMGSQQLLTETYLPIALSVPNVSDTAVANDYIVEPTVQELMDELIPKVLSQQLFTMLLDLGASEHAARMLAMQAATDNANSLIQELTKQYNKSRQQAITNELLDIIGGSFK